MIKNKHCLIVGSSGTIGSAVARRLAGIGVALGLHHCRNRAAVEDLQKEFETTNILCDIFQADLMSEGECVGLIDDFYNRFGTIDVLAICHGEVNWRNWQDLEWPDWSIIFQQHCMAPFSLVKRAIPYMMENGGGRVIYLSSISPKYAGSARSIHYASAKGALEIMMRGLAREVARSGICINGVRAGFVLTPQQETGRNQKEIEERIGKIPVRRAGKPEEIAAAFQYLMSEEAGFVTGEIISVAGGD
jgi:3-oxoacyl-[acyl-carrier protein] reductase